MSTLQVSLAAAGVLLLALIVAFNAWQHWRRAPRPPQQPSASPNAAAPQSTPVTAADAPRVTASDHNTQRFEPAIAEPHAAVQLVGEPRPQTAFEALGHVGASAGELTQQSAADAFNALDMAAERNKEPSLDAPAAAAFASAGAGAAQHGAILHSLIDALATMDFAQPVAGEALLMVAPTTSRAGNKPFRVEAFNAASNDWESIRVGQRYTKVRAGVQLANRLGALNSIEFSEFAAKVTQMADGLGASAALPDMMQEVRRAAELDHFAAQNDVQLDFWLRAQQSGGWSVAFVQQHAQALGFETSNVDGRWVLPSPQLGGAPVLTLSIDPQAVLPEQLPHSAIYEVQLGLDVAQVPQSEHPLRQLHQVAIALCSRMGAVLCDQNGQVVDDAALQVIAPRLDEIYAQLAARDLAAGSALARRLFS